MNDVGPTFTEHAISIIPDGVEAKNLQRAQREYFSKNPELKAQLRELGMSASASDENIS